MEGLRSVFEYYTKGTLNNIYVDKDSLVFSGNKTTSTSWIPLTDANNEVLRYGKMLEINALWYNAVKILQILHEVTGKKRKATKYEKFAETVRESFKTTFLDENGTVADFIVQDKKNFDFRINQLIPLMLPFSVYDDDFAVKKLEEIENCLLTPFGIRSAKAVENETTLININRKTPLYFNGAIWPWAIDFYVSASLKYAKDKKEKARYLKGYFAPLINQINKGLINYLPEAITYNSSTNQNGIVDYTPSLSCLFWSYYKLEKELN